MGKSLIPDNTYRHLTRRLWYTTGVAMDIWETKGTDNAMRSS